MADLLQSRKLAEHLSALASLLEAEAIRACTLGLKTHKDIAYKAYEVRHLADRLWEADTAFEVAELSRKKPFRHKRDPALSVVARQC